MACPLYSAPILLPPISEKPSEAIVRPDIDWIPSFKVYKARVERLASLGLDRPTAVPGGWPAEVDSERCWSGSDLKEEDFVIKFTAEDIAEIDAALDHFKGLDGDLTPDDVNQTTFPLPNLAPRLHEVARTIHFGRGFVILRGLNPDKYSDMDNLYLYLGITSYIAETRGRQDFDGRMLLHVQKVVDEDNKKNVNSPYVARAQPFHTDLCDVLSLYCRNTAAYGGESFLASSAKIYNELARTRPDLIHVLAKDDWPFDEFFENQHHFRPLLHLFPTTIPTNGTSGSGGGPVFQFSRRPLTGAHFSPHHPLVPALSEVQAEALDAVYFTAKAHALCVTLERGDVEIFNNFAMMHARSAFTDEGGDRRHMMRLWLRNEEMRWTLPGGPDDNHDEQQQEVKGVSEVGGAHLRRLSAECYGPWESGVVERKWDVEASPVELRVKHRRSSCA